MPPPGQPDIERFPVLKRFLELQEKLTIQYFLQIARRHSYRHRSSTSETIVREYPTAPVGPVPAAGGAANH